MEQDVKDFFVRLNTLFYIMAVILDLYILVIAFVGGESFWCCLIVSLFPVPVYSLCSMTISWLFGGRFHLHLSFNKK